MTSAFLGQCSAVSGVEQVASLYLRAAGIKPVQIQSLRHRLHRPASHVMKPIAVFEELFTHEDFLHLSSAAIIILPLAGLPVTLDPAISSVDQISA